MPRDEFAAWRGSLFNDLIASRRVDTGGEQPVTVDELNLLYRITEAFDVMQSLEPGDLSKTLLGIVEGGTGVGKSTVLEEVDLPVVEEHVDTNFWLASAASPDLGVAKSAAFTAQLYFMVGRLHDLAGAFNDHTNIPGKVVADRFLEGDKAYIDMRVEAGHITPAEREILNATRELLAPLVPPTENHRTVFLFCDEDQLERRIVERGREYELGGNLPNQVGMQALTMVELGI
ncbi:MAG: deoxynucleoside kinase, partial [Candidatus Dojkabacteria bacterium]